MMDIVASYVFNNHAYIVFADGTVYRVRPDYKTKVVIEQVGRLPLNG
jgi:hypothetical protein